MMWSCGRLVQMRSGLVSAHQFRRGGQPVVKAVAHSDP
jgi:hypothetical protein